MAAKKTPGSYAIGYAKPPRHTQFRKGQSGNPNGRPKGTLNFATVLTRTLREEVVINERGRRKTITKLEVAAKQLVNKGASGDLAALRLLFLLVQMAEERVLEAATPTEVLEEADRKVMLSIVKRFGAGTKGDIK